MASWLCYASEISTGACLPSSGLVPRCARIHEVVPRATREPRGYDCGSHTSPVRFVGRTKTDTDGRLAVRPDSCSGDLHDSGRAQRQVPSSRSFGRCGEPSSAPAPPRRRHPRPVSAIGARPRPCGTTPMPFRSTTWTSPTNWTRYRTTGDYEMSHTNTLAKTDEELECDRRGRATNRLSVLPASDHRSVFGAAICWCARPERRRQSGCAVPRQDPERPSSFVFVTSEVPRLGERSGLSLIATSHECRDNGGCKDLRPATFHRYGVGTNAGDPLRCGPSALR